VIFNNFFYLCFKHFVLLFYVITRHTDYYKLDCRMERENYDPPMHMGLRTLVELRPNTNFGHLMRLHPILGNMMIN